MFHSNYYTNTLKTKQNKINYTVHHKQAQHVQFSTVTIVQPANCVNKVTAT